MILAAKFTRKCQILIKLKNIMICLKKTPKLPKTVEKPKVVNTKPITMEQPKY